MLVAKIQSKVKQFYSEIVFGPRRTLRKYLTPCNGSVKLLRLGSMYGGWTIVETPELKNGVAVLCGAGEDVSFDLTLQGHCGCEIIIVDPTPRAVEHFQKLSAARAENKVFAINNSDEFYQYDNVNFQKIRYIPTAIWCARDVLKFWVPVNSGHVSHSLTNIQQSKRYIEVEAKPLSDILSENNYRVSDLCLLKLDIEGAEIEVIESICNSGIFPQQILVEFDEVNFPDSGSNKKITKAVELLLKCGYAMIHYDGTSNCLFLRN